MSARGLVHVHSGRTPCSCSSPVPEAFPGCGPGTKEADEESHADTAGEGTPMIEHESWTGGCLCGRCRYTVSGKPSHIGYCHCSMCRKATGGPFAILVRVEGEEIDWSNPPTVYRSSPIARRGFCPQCGTPLYLEYDGDSRTRLTIGSVDRPDGFPPQSHYGVEGRLPWVDCSMGLPEQETKENW